MQHIIQQIQYKSHLLAQKTKKWIHSVESNPKLVNYIMYGNCVLIAFFIGMIFFLNQHNVSRYLDIRSSISRLKEVSEGYELELTRSQVTLKPNINKINMIIKIVSDERVKISKLVEQLDDKAYHHHIEKYLEVLDKRLVIRDELMSRYAYLARLYQDYMIAARNAENVAFSDVTLQLEMKHIMLHLEKVRLISEGKNRDLLFKKINILRNKLIYHDPNIQEKVGLFVDQSEEIIKLLRYLDTVRFSMRSDGHDVLLENLKNLTAEKIRFEEIKFMGKLFVFLSVCIALVAIQFIILTIFFINKRKIEKLRKEALETIEKSKEIAERSKQYALQAQRTQYKLLHNFCGDFDTVISSVSEMGHELKLQSLKSVDGDVLMPDSHKLSINILCSSITSLEAWLANYLDVYTAKDEWRSAAPEAVDVTQFFDNNFAQIRFFTKNRDHLLAISHEAVPDEIEIDTEYTLKLLMNMVYISMKWSEDSWLKLDVSLKKNAENDADSRENSLLNISIVNGSSQAIYDKALELFHMDNAALGSDERDEANHENRFIISAIYYIRQICDVLKATLKFERNIVEENLLTISLPIKTIDDSLSVGDISVPLLSNKNVLVVSPFVPILRTLEKQLKDYGMNVTALTDKYSAIGHIIGGEENQEKYDLFILDHHPDYIDACALAKIIRENTHKNLVHIIVISTESHLNQIEKDKSLYDVNFIKPVKPKELKKKLEECIEIQLYGAQSDNDKEEKSADDIKTYRFLAVMNEDLSSMLLQLIITKTNYEVDVVSSSSQIFDLLEQKCYDFVLVSNAINWIIIENLARDIRRHHTDNRESVIILIYDEIKDNYRAKLIKNGFDDFIKLPLSRVDFLETVSEWEDPVRKRMIIANGGVDPKQLPTEEVLDELSSETKIDGTN